MTENRCINCMRKRTDSGGACPYCGFDPGQYKPPEQTLPPGTTLNHGKYIIGRVLGRGGFGVTYVALDTTLDLRVAVKECIPRNCAWRNDSGASVQWGLSVPEQEMMLESFVKEARKMAKIDRIPGVVRVREYFYDNETAYIVMDYVDGETLREYLKRKGPLNAEACFRVLAPAMDSLAQAHKRGLIHRDISPNNIMIETNGERVWVLDLGAAKDLGTKSSAENVTSYTRVGATSGYAPSEQYRKSGKIGPWTDVYAISAVFFRCMTGQKPPESLDREDEDTLPELLRTIRGPVGAVLMKGMAQKPKERYQTVTELRNALEKAVDDTAPTKTYDEPTEIFPQESETPQKPEPKKRMLAPILLLCVALALVGLGIMRLNREPPAEIIASGECGENATWTLDENGLLTISGTGNMANYTHDPWDAPYRAYQNMILGVEILEGISNIGEMAFWQCGNLQSVKVPDSVKEIEWLVFRDCVSLTSFKIPDGVTMVSPGLFYGCSNLTSVIIPDSVTGIANTAFYGCSSLTHVEIPDSVTGIGRYAFGGCTHLESVSIPDSVTEIGEGVFAGCVNLTNVSVPAGAKIADNAFDENTTVTVR